MCENPYTSDLGDQEPKGCRYITGTPGAGAWRYCQDAIVNGGRPGDVNNPPYCAAHRAKTYLAQRPYKWQWRTQYDMMAGAQIGPDRDIVRAAPADEHRKPVDLLIQLAHKGLLHD